MGSGLSAQEQQFIQCQWTDLISSPDQNGSVGDGFRLYRHEWQALAALAEDTGATPIPSMLLDRSISEDLPLESTILAPLVAAACHVAAIAEGQVVVSVGLERVMRLRHLGVASQRHGSLDAHLQRVQQLVQTVFLQQHGSALVTCQLEKETLSMQEAVSCMKQTHGLIRALLNGAEEMAANRPVVAFALHMMTAFFACFSTDSLLSFAVRRAPVGGQMDIVHCTRQSLLFAVAEAQSIHERLLGAGYSVERSPIMDFSVLRRLQDTIRTRLLLLDVVETGSTPPLRVVRQKLDSWEDVATCYIGQRHIVDVLQRHFEAKSRGITENNKPTVMLFFGPSGHGKSELAKLVAKVLHPSVDCTESSGKLVFVHLPSFCTSDSIYSLVDPPAAHVGEGMLLSAVRKEPRAVVVLDEFEKSTADSIQNLWLSAFQKDGMLRSLKDASRSTSTINVTFVLTCNIAADVILGDESLYLAATVDEQASKRDAYVAECRRVVMERFGQPFANRIDFFFPFVPYTPTQRRDFAAIQISRIVEKQYKDFGRLLVPTPSYISAVAARSGNFHSATVARMVQDALSRFPTQPATRFSHAHVSFSRKSTPQDEPCDFSTSETLLVSPPELGEMLSKLVGAPACEELVRAAADKSSSVFLSSAKHTSSLPSSAARSVNPAAVAQPQQHTERSAAKPTHSKVELQKDRELEIERELSLLKEQLKEKIVECEKLRATVKELQKIVALLVLFSTATILLLSLIVGLKATMLLVSILFIACYVLCKNFLSLLLGALVSFYNFMGPFRSSVLVLLLAVYVYFSTGYSPCAH